MSYAEANAVLFNIMDEEFKSLLDGNFLSFFTIINFAKKYIIKRFRFLLLDKPNFVVQH